MDSSRTPDLGGFLDASQGAKIGQDAAPDAPKMLSKIVLNIFYSGVWFEIDFVSNFDTPNPSKLCSRYSAVPIFHILAICFLDTF